MNKKTILFSTILLQIITIAYLGTKISHKVNLINQVLGIKSHPFSKYKPIDRKPGDPLKYFREPPPNSKIKTYPWIASKPLYTINSDTLNERFDYSLQKPKNTYRIISLGDSFTFGASVPISKNYPEVLENLLNQACTHPQIQKYQVINLGVGAYDIEYAVKRYKKRGKKYNPDLILWLIKSDDLIIIRELKKPINQQIWQNLQPINSKEVYKKAGDKSLQTFHSYYKLSQIITYNKKALELLNLLPNQKLLILTFNHTSKKYKTILKNFAAHSDQTRYFGQLPNFQELNYTAADGHPNQQGYQLIAESILNHLKAAQIIPCL